MGEYCLIAQVFVLMTALDQPQEARTVDGLMVSLRIPRLVSLIGYCPLSLPLVYTYSILPLCLIE